MLELPEAMVVVAVVVCVGDGGECGGGASRD